MWNLVSPHSHDSNSQNIYEHAFQPRRLRNPSVTILKEILKTVRLDEDLMRNNRMILKSFLESFIPAMKEVDPLFNILYQRPYFMGSFYADLRIVTPDEFDIILVLHIPLNPREFIIQYHPQVPSYAKFRLIDPSRFFVRHPRMSKLFDNCWLNQEKVRTWFQSVIDRAMRLYHPPVDIRRVVNSASGPARTLKLIKASGGQIDIDLVPAIYCTLPTNQPGIDYRVHYKFAGTLTGFLVPKPYSPVGQPPVNRAEISHLWRAHFPDAENSIIHDVGCVKPVIRLLKLLRDKEGWNILASYYLKTVVMWMLLHNSSAEYWAENNMGERFIDSLEVLEIFVAHQNIPYFFSKRHNLIYKMNSYQANNIQNRLKFIIRLLKSNPDNLWGVFNVSHTFILS